MNNFGQRLATLRTERGWSQGELSRRSGISQPVISMIEGHKVQNPRHLIVMKLAQAFQMSTDDLVGPETQAPVYEEPALPLAG